MEVAYRGETAVFIASTPSFCANNSLELFAMKCYINGYELHDSNTTYASHGSSNVLVCRVCAEHNFTEVVFRVFHRRGNKSFFSCSDTATMHLIGEIYLIVCSCVCVCACAFT